MSTELIAAELKIRLNFSLPCAAAYYFFLSKPELTYDAKVIAEMSSHSSLG